MIHLFIQQVLTLCNERIERDRVLNCMFYVMSTESERVKKLFDTSHYNLLKYMNEKHYQISMHCFRDFKIYVNELLCPISTLSSAYDSKTFCFNIFILHFSIKIQISIHLYAIDSQNKCKLESVKHTFQK